MKKTGKKIITVLLVLIMVACVGGCAYFYSKEETMTLAENQRYAYAYITSIQGNEVTYMEVDESLVVTEEGTEETVTTYIPVGVTVHTADDMKTTFSRLYSGDIVKMLLESNADGEEVIVEIWMME